MSSEEKQENTEFCELEMLLDWFRCEWGDEHDPATIPPDVDNVIEIEEDFELQDVKDISHKELSGTETLGALSPPI